MLLFFLKWYYIQFDFLINIDKFGLYLGRWLNLAFDNGFSWIGFVLGFMYVLKVVSTHKKWQMFEIADLSVFGIIIAQIFFRIGQFLDGSWIGKVTFSPLGLNFPGVEGARHPLSLYEIPVLFIIYFLLTWLEKRYRFFTWYQNDRGEAKPGFLWQTYIILLLSESFVLDWVFDKRNVILWIISLRQIILFILFLIAIFIFWLQAGHSINLERIKKVLIPEEKEDLKTIIPPDNKLTPHEKPRRFFRVKAGTDAK